MKYNFDINKFLRLVLSSVLKTTNRLKWMDSISVSFKNLLNEFETFRNDIDLRTQYSSEQLVLQTLLNNLFDSTLQRIIIETTSDIKPLYYSFNSGEPFNFQYSYFGAEAKPPMYGYFGAELANAYNFEVRIPSAIDTVANRNKIAAWVNYYRLSSLTFIIKTI